MAAVALVAVIVTGGTGIDRGVAAGPTGPLEYLGELSRPFPTPGTSSVEVAAIDAAGRRLYGIYNFGQSKYLVTYDLDHTVPKVLASRQVPYSVYGQPAFAAAVAPSRKRVFYLTQGATGFDGVITAIGVEGDSTLTSWVMAEKLPGFSPMGITYAQADDRIYAVGEMNVAYPLASWGAGRKLTGIVTTVAAFDPDDGSLIWARPVPECGQVIHGQGLGSVIGRSTALPTPTLVLACGTGGNGFGDTYPGQAGALELRIDPTAGLAEAATFDVHFHPISGSYYNGGSTGFAVYDPGSDRLFVQSLSVTTPGTWVFDARLGGWAGFIASPAPGVNNYGGLHPGTGHYFMGGPRLSDARRFLIVADGRSSPPQNGVFADKSLSPQGFINGDALTDRVFISRGVGNLSIVARDLSRSVDPLERPDYDAQTDDVDETPDTFVSFSGDTGGFGARVTAVGDTSGATGPVPIGETLETTAAPLATGVGAPGISVPAATRGAVFARVATASVQPSGAAAAAQAASSDTTTGQAVDQNGLSWPFEPRTCLDGGEGAESEPAESIGGRAEVRCTLATYESNASARQAGVDTGLVSIGDTRVETKVKRTAKDGMSTVSTSSATGVRVEVPGAGMLEIGKVETVARTTAHGRSGTATAEWTRKVADVTVTVAGEKYGMAGCAQTVKHDGKKATPSGDGGACDALAEAVRRLLQVRVRLLFPTPAVDATPKGAFARVGQTDTDAAREVTVNDQGKVFPNDATTRRTVPGLQVDVYHDSTERSRYIVQLAGAENSSIYTVNTSPDDAPCDMGGCIPGGFDGLPPLAGTEVPSSSDGSMETSASFEGASLASDIPTPATTTGGGRRPSSSDGRSNGLDGLILARRSLGDGGLMASFVLLVAGAVGAVARRRRLSSVLAA